MKAETHILPIGTTVYDKENHQTLTKLEAVDLSYWGFEHGGEVLLTDRKVRTYKCFENLTLPTNI